MAEKICVTGCTGFLGSWVVKYALDAGFIVHATLRSENKAGFLQNLEGAKDRLKLFSGCDLTKQGSFDEAIRGCKTVIHTASPFIRIDTEDGRQKLIEPAVQGTETVLQACSSLGVEKVVLTGSIACVYMAYGTKEPEYVFSDDDWSDADLLEEKKNYYALSKLLAERLAWDKAKTEGCPFKLATINPSLIYGPMLPGQTHLNTSCNSLLGYFKASKIKQQSSTITDVRDVARAHVMAAQMGLDWKGWGHRYLLIGAAPMLTEIVDVLRTSDKVSEEQKAKLPTELDPKIPSASSGAPPPHQTKYDVQNSLKPTEEGGLGLGEYRSVREMVEGTYESMMENGFDSQDKYTLDKE